MIAIASMLIIVLFSISDIGVTASTGRRFANKDHVVEDEVRRDEVVREDKGKTYGYSNVEQRTSNVECGDRFAPSIH